ncbi:hypothetical protein [Streptomyces sp. NPDC048277]|uniref:hypothetical protein n=1 Tax=Streptomyces sp. NPDC048277 TaxID=3155027 RepID=UPI0033D5520B
MNVRSRLRGGAGVGADTTQDVMNALGNEIRNSTGEVIASWNATGPSWITTKPTGSCTFTRPDGSNAGITALNTALDGNTGCVDFARSTRGPVDFSTTDLTFIPYAKDALSWAKRWDSPLPDDLTTAQLHDIYACTLTSLNGVPLTPHLPLGAAEEARFLAFIAVATPGPCVTTGPYLQENDGTALVGAGDIMPYSTAQYVAQETLVVDDRRGDSVLGKVNGFAPSDGEFTTNWYFPFLYDVYNVVPTAELSDPVFAATFVGPASAVCANTELISEYSFLTIGTDCGRTDLKGEK